MKRFVCQFLVAALFLNAFTLFVRADALNNWTPGIVSTNPFGYAGMQMMGVAYGNSKYVGVGQYVEDDYGFAETSSDGTNWAVSTRYDGSVLDLYDVTFANGTFVASGWDYYGGNNLYSSTDGSNWTPHTTTIANLYRVTYGGGLFVAVGDGISLWSGGPTNKNIYTSPNGITWTARVAGTPTGTADRLTDIAYGAGIFVAVGGGYFHTSTGGTSWVRNASSYPLAGNVSYCNGLFIAPSGPGTNLMSTDGTTWSVRTNNTSAIFGRVVYTNGLYLALSNSILQSTSTAIFTSTNGTNWVQRNLPGPTNALLAALVFANGRFVVVGYQPTLPVWNVIYPAAYISDPLVGLGVNSGFPPQIKISGVQGLLYGIQYSTTLSPPNWQTLTTFTMGNSPAIWTDNNATNSQRFYRGEWLP
ncbi:MAG TPA: hypothetical protein VMH87_05275 [Pseudomonadales bacterium]|nr:hypothetical protein [Pseudomonadales bacterium]